LVEWNESEGAIKQIYSGFRKWSLGVVQFDTTRNSFFVVGDEFHPNSFLQCCSQTLEMVA
jgi:hypothetical protein